MRVVFLGSKSVGLRCLEAMLDCAPGAVVAALTIDDSTDVRSVHSEFVTLAREKGLRLETLKRRDEFRRLIQQYSPDLCIVAGWYWLVPADLIAAVAHGFVGIHFSLLPRYRGGSPLVWAMIAGERETGVSMFSLVKEVDAGDIWGQRRVLIGPNEYIGTVLQRLEDQEVDLIRSVFPRMLTGEATPTPQVHSQATFCSPRRPEDGLIDWRWPAEQILRFVRSQSRPYPGAFTHGGGQRITVWRATAGGSHDLVPGTVIRVAGDVLVVCGDGNAIRLDEIEVRDGAGSVVDILDVSIDRLDGSDHVA